VKISADGPDASLHSPCTEGDDVKRGQAAASSRHPQYDANVRQDAGLARRGALALGEAENGGEAGAEPVQRSKGAVRSHRSVQQGMDRRRTRTPRRAPTPEATREAVSRRLHGRLRGAKDSLSKDDLPVHDRRKVVALNIEEGEIDRSSAR